MQLRGLKLKCKPLPDGDGQIFGGRDAREKFRHFLVQKTVVERVQYFAVQNFFQLLQVNDKAGARIDFPLHSYF